MTFKTLQTSMAVLSANKNNLGVAVCRFDSEINEQGESPRVMIMPDGYFKSHDGRPGDVQNSEQAWLLDQTAFTSLSQAAASRTNDFHFDYEHQTMLAESNGKPAPASGWFNPRDLEYIPGQGLFALNVRWTPAAREHLKNDEYRFISPVFHYDKATGRPIKLRHFALTNDPALDGMDKVAVLKNHLDLTKGPTAMNKAQQLLELLGVTVSGDVTDAHYQEASTVVKKLQKDSEQTQQQLSNTHDQVAALKANRQNGEVNLAKFVPVETYNALHAEVVALKSSTATQTVAAEISKAKQDGRIVEAEIEYLTRMGNQQGVAALKAVLDVRTPIVSLTTHQTQTTQPPEKEGIAVLTTEEKYAADQLGISHTDYAESKQEQ